MTTYLITGGAGFIGSHLVDAVLLRGDYVRIFDNLSTGSDANLAHLSDRADLGERLEFREGDIRDLNAVRAAMEDVDYVLHHAALSSVPLSLRHPERANAINVGGTLNVLIAAHEAGVRRVVYASSSSVYGEAPELPKDEEMIPNPCSPYAVSKYAGELYCRVFTRVYGLETVCLRYFNVFGPRQDPSSPYSAVIPLFVDRLLRGETFYVHGDGEQTRDFAFVSDIVQANLLACEAPNVAGETFNVARGEQISINKLLELIQGIMKCEADIAPDDPRPGDIRHSLADISKARRLLGYNPSVDLKTGLHKTIKWMQTAMK